MKIHKNEINNMIKLLFTIAFSVSLPERGLSYPKCQPPYTFPHFFLKSRDSLKNTNQFSV